MKSSFGKLKKLAFQKNDGKERKEFQPLAKLDELAQASQEMEDMRNCYDSLLLAAAATVNSAYEFSESLREMGDCLLEKTNLYNDEDSGKALSMLGNVQFELHKLVDLYRSHVILTITNPSESLINELRRVEEMKRQCDEKRSVYEYMVAQQREKTRSKSGKGETFTLQQLQTAQSDYEEEAMLCVFRLKSLKQGQSRSLLTQAARHHTAQLNFFRKAYKSLEAVDESVKLVTEKHHIDYQVSGLDDGDDVDDDENVHGSNDYGELSFDYRQNKPLEASTPRTSMEVDQEDQSFPKASSTESMEVNLGKNHGDFHAIDGELRISSHSAPIMAEKKFDPAERIRQMRPPSTQKILAYVLPTPADAKSSSSNSSGSVPRMRPVNRGGHSGNIWHSSPLENKMQKTDSKDKLSGSIFKVDSVYNDGNSHETSTHLLPLAEGCSHRDVLDASDHKKVKRQAFSGPLSSKPQSMKPGIFSSGPIASSELPKPGSGSVSQAPLPQPPSSSKKSPSISPTSVSPPRISELHELPRPPSIAGIKSGKQSALFGHSAPLVSRNPDLSGTTKTTNIPNTASPLPTPPLTISRSFSIPSSNLRAMSSHANKLLGSPLFRGSTEEISSPPLTPLSLSNAKSIVSAPGLGTQSADP